MSLQSRLLDIIPIATGSGTKTTNNNLTIADLSHARQLLLELELTTIATVAATTLNVVLQETTNNGISWNDRARFPLIAGNATASAIAPLVRRMALVQIMDVAAVNASYTPSGSSDGAALGAGQTITGPFPGVMRFDGVQGKIHGPTWRIQLVEADAAGTGNFVGVIRVFSVAEYER